VPEGAILHLIELGKRKTAPPGRGKSELLRILGSLWLQPTAGRKVKESLGNTDRRMEKAFLHSIK